MLTEMEMGFGLRESGTTNMTHWAVQMYPEMQPLSCSGLPRDTAVPRLSHSPEAVGFGAQLCTCTFCAIRPAAGSCSPRCAVA